MSRRKSKSRLVSNPSGTRRATRSRRGKNVASVVDLVRGGDFATGNLCHWRVNSPDGVIGVATSNSGLLSPQRGDFYCFLGDLSAPGSIRQTLSTMPGQQYTVSFYLSHYNYTGPPDSELVVTLDGMLLLSLRDAEGFPCTLFSFEVTATATSTEIVFSARDATGGFGLDHVAVTGVMVAPATRSLAPLRRLRVAVHACRRRALKGVRVRRSYGGDSSGHVSDIVLGNPMPRYLTVARERSGFDLLWSAGNRVR